MPFLKIIQQNLSKILFAVAGFLIVILIFTLGVFIGSKKADFSYEWAAAYHRNFGGPQGGLLGNLVASTELTSANGSFGKIISIDNEEKILLIEDASGIEKSVTINPETPIMFQKRSIKLPELNLGDSVVIIGKPIKEGKIQAQLIRKLPVSPEKKLNKNKN